MNTSYWQENAHKMVNKRYQQTVTVNRFKDNKNLFCKLLKNKSYSLNTSRTKDNLEIV